MRAKGKSPAGFVLVFNCERVSLPLGPPCPVEDADMVAGAGGGGRGIR